MMTASAPTPSVSCRTAATGSVVAVQGPDAFSFRQLEFDGVEVDPDHPAPMGLQQLGGKQADQPQSDHHNGFTESRRRKADALQRDGADHGEGRLVVGHLFRDQCRQVSGHANDLRVVAVGGHPVADLELLDAAADFDDAAHVAVAEGQG